MATLVAGIGLTVRIAAESRKGQLHYLLSDPAGPHAVTLAGSDQRTTRAYRARGVSVKALPHAAFTDWLSGPGAPYRRATPMFQRLAFARDHSAAALGGLMVYDVSQEEAKIYGIEPDSCTVSWGLSREACTVNDELDIRAVGTSQAIPLYLGGRRADPWAVPEGLEARACDDDSVPGAAAPAGLKEDVLRSLECDDIEGNRVRWSDFAGKVVILDFWATSCAGCILELPISQMLWERFRGDGLVWLAVSADEHDVAWRRFVRANRLGGIQVRVPHWVHKLGVNAFPTIIVVGRSGRPYCQARGSSLPPVVAELMRRQPDPTE